MLRQSLLVAVLGLLLTGCAVHEYDYDDHDGYRHHSHRHYDGYRYGYDDRHRDSDYRYRSYPDYRYRTVPPRYPQEQWRKPQHDSRYFGNQRQEVHRDRRHDMRHDDRHHDYRHDRRHERHDDDRKTLRGIRQPDSRRAPEMSRGHYRNDPKAAPPRYHRESSHRSHEQRHHEW